ncbi:MAG: hypothetical protein D3917_10755 [Candidatus Electrothrix sp. AX5]|nr:hypothetical protein [Candidatus Electrothrix sp. AX5]
MERENTQSAVELAEVIEGLRNELEKAQESGEGKAIRFGVNDIEIELELTIAKKLKAGGGVKGKADSSAGLVKYFVGKLSGEISLQGEAEYQKVSTQKVKLSLSAESPDGKKTTLSGPPRP